MGWPRYGTLMSLEFKIEPLEPIWEEIVRIASQQWEESDYNIHGIPINLDKARYLKFNELGLFLMFTARDGGVLVGYAGMYLMPSMHTQTPTVTEDTLFLLPDYRKGRNAIRFYQFIEQEYTRIVGFAYPDATLFELSFTTKLSNGAGRILKYLDFRETALLHMKTIFLPLRAYSAQPDLEEAEHVRTITASRT
jgi:hypothetical protein